MFHLAGCLVVVTSVLGQADAQNAGPHEQLKSLDPFVGSWEISMADGRSFPTTFRWVNNGHFLIRESGQRDEWTPIVFGWDPVAGEMVRWAFGMNGGFSRAVWKRTDDGGWVSECDRWIQPDGSIGKSTLRFSDPSKGDVTIEWERQIGEEPLSVSVAKMTRIGPDQAEHGQELLTQFAKDYVGTWIQETEVDEEIPGYAKVGDEARVQLAWKPIVGGQGFQATWDYQVNGKSVAEGVGITTLDSRKRILKTSTAWSGGGTVETIHVFGEGKWRESAVGVLPNGVVFSGNSTITFSEDGTTRTDELTEQIGLDGKPKKDRTENWVRVRK